MIMASIKNALTMAGTLAIADFIKNNREALAGAGYEYAASYMNSKNVLPHSITRSNVKSVETAMGLNFINMHTKTATHKSELADRVEKLEKIVAALCVSLGYPN